MNHRGLPPERDNDLRHAISLNRDEQVRLLHGLAGEKMTVPALPTLEDGRSFTHYGATTTTGPRGALVYMPTPIPSNIAGPDADVVFINVDHGDLDRRAFPRHPTTIAKLKSMIETALPLRGTHHLRIHTPPRRWTAAHLEWLARTMASYLPPSKTPEPIDFNMFGFKSNSIELSVRRHKAWRAFRVSCEVSPIGLRPALDDWQTVNGGWGAVLGHEPLTPLPEPPDPRDEHDQTPDADTDDLDTIEKACRRRLHDERAIPPTSRGKRRSQEPPALPPPPQDLHAGMRTFNDLAIQSPETFAILARIAGSVLSHLEGGR